jgi:hypothetical protein
MDVSGSEPFLQTEGLAPWICSGEGNMSSEAAGFMPDADKNAMSAHLAACFTAYFLIRFLSCANFPAQLFFSSSFILPG